MWDMVWKEGSLPTSYTPLINAFTALVPTIYTFRVVNRGSWVVEVL
jgi:hypothetical protein